MSLNALSGWASVRLAGVVVGLAMAAACSDSCCAPPNPPGPDGGVPALAFNGLQDAYACADDEDPSTNGVQVTIKVAIANDDGSGFNSVSVAVDGGTPVSGNIGADGVASVVVTLVSGVDPGHVNALHATSSNGTATIAVDDTVNNVCFVTGGGTASCTITSPLQGATLTSSPAAFTVHTTSTGVSAAVAAFVDTAQVKVTATPTNGGTATNGAAQLVSGDGSGTLPLPSDTAASLQCSFVDPTNVLAGTTISTPAIDVVIAIDTTVTITFPTAGTVFSDADDTNNNLVDGVNLRPATATSPANNPATFDLLCTGAPAVLGGACTVSGSASPFDISCPLPGTGTSTCTLTIKQVGASPVSVSYAINSSAPSLTVTVAPDANGDGFYDVADDSVPGTAGVIDVPVTVHTDTLPPGTWTGTLVVTDSAGNVIQTIDLGTVTAGTDVSPSPVVQLPVGDNVSYSISVTVTDGTDTSPAFGATAVVDTVAPVVSYLVPVSGQGLNASNDLDSATAGLQIAVQVGVSLDTASCTLTIDAVPVVGNVSNGLCGTTVTFPDGTHTLVASATDGAGHVTTLPSINFNTDGSVPTVNSIVVVAAGADNTLNVADNGNVVTAGNVTSDVAITTSADMVGRTVTGTTSQGTCTGVVVTGTNAATLTGCTFAQGSQTLVLTGTDGGGNPLDVTTTSLTILVDTVPPTVAVDAPAAGQLTAANDVDPATAGLQTDIAVASDAEGRTVHALVNGTECGTGTILNGGATIRCTLPEGNDNITATATDAANNLNTSAAVAVSVDSIPPALTLTAGNVAPADDLNGNPADGIQVHVTVVSTGLTAGRTITITSDQEGDIGTCGASGSGTTTCTVTYFREATHRLVATATDEVGNLGTSNTVTVNVVTGLFFVNITNPPLRAGFRSIGIAEDTNQNVAGAQVIITATTDAPNGSVVSVIVKGLAAVTTCTVNNGVITCTPITFTDGDTGSLEVTVTSGIKTGNSGVDTYHVDLTRPTTTITNPVGANVTFNQASDASAAAGLQTTVTVSVTGCENGVLRILDGNTNISGSGVNVPAGGSGTFDVAVSTTRENDAESWTAVCTDAEGNAPTTPGGFTAKVDITPPTAGNITTTVVDVRSGDVRLAYTQPGDNGIVGTATTVQVFCSKGAIDANNFGTGAGQVAIPLGAHASDAGGTAETINTAGLLAFDNTWTCAVRAVDDVGNTSGIGTGQATIATTQVVLTAPAGVSGWGQSVSRSAGDINNDGIDDFVVGAPDQAAFAGGSASPGGFEVILGGTAAANLQRTFVNAPATLSFCSTGACTPNYTGWAVNILSSINGDAFDDVAVVAYDQDANQEFVLIYAGGPNGIAANATPVSVLEAPTFGAAGYNVQSLGDIDGDGRVDWGFTAPFLGTAFVFLNTGAFPPSGLMTARATTIITSTDPAQTFFASSIAPVGTNGDAFGDFAIGSQSAPRIFIVRGRATWPATIDAASLTGNDVVTLGVGAANSPAFEMTSGDVDGDGRVDIIYATNSASVVVHNVGATWSGETTYVGTPTLFQGSGPVAGDLTGDNRADVVAGGAASTPVSVFDGTNPIVAKSSGDTVYPFTSTGSGIDFFSFGIANVLGGAASAPDIIIAHGTGTVLIRF